MRKKTEQAVREWNERSNARSGFLADTDSMFQLLFERSADAILLFDPHAGVFVDCNASAIDLMRAASKEQVLNASPAELSPALQPDGCASGDKATEIAALAQRNGTYRFEWIARRFD